LSRFVTGNCEEAEADRISFDEAWLHAAGAMAVGAAGDLAQHGVVESLASGRGRLAQGGRVLNARVAMIR
jgi:hypothetical protein